MKWRKNWGTYLVVVVFMVSSGALFYYSVQPVPDLNDTYQVERNNGEPVWVYDQGNMVLLIGEATNVTSGNDLIVSFWYNTSYFQNVTLFTFVYFNGTHRYQDWEGRFVENGYPDFRWWTDGFSFVPSMFGNASQFEWLGYRIPTQAANTTVSYLVALRMEVDSGVSFRYYEDDYTVLYSEAQNEELRVYTQTSYYYGGAAALACFVLVALIRAHKLAVSLDESKQTHLEPRVTDKRDKAEYPTAKDYIDRADRIDDLRNDLRTASDLLLFLAVAFLFYELQVHTEFSLRFLGPLILILCSLTSIMISLSSTLVKHKGASYDLSLLPNGGSESDYREGLVFCVKRRENIVTSMKLAIQVGIISAMFFYLFDTILHAVRPFSPLLWNPLATFLWQDSFYSQP